VLQGGGGTAIAGAEPLEVASDLTRAEGDTAGGQGLAELAARPGPFLGQQLAQGPGDPITAFGVGGRPAAERIEGRGAAGGEGAERVADGLGVAAEVRGDLWRRPAGVGEGRATAL
jgi:hypothetical protein